jgi:AcrR family transcriptional regulator
MAALELFTERGYDDTTVAEIADRAGLTRSTFFRHFPDKRDVLAAGQGVLSELFGEGIAAAPQGASPLDAVQHGLEAAAEAMTPFNRELGSRMHAIIERSAELQERNRLKHIGLASSMAEALRTRGESPVVSALAGEIGMLAFTEAFGAWVGAEDAQDLRALIQTAMEKYREAITRIG